MFKYIPPDIIFDQNSKISPFLAFNMKKKKENFITADRAQLNIKNLQITIPSFKLLKSKLIRLNPFSTLHT